MTCIKQVDKPPGLVGKTSGQFYLLPSFTLGNWVKPG